MLRHPLHFIGGVILRIAACSRMPDGLRRDRAKACNVVAVGEPVKAKDTIRRLERDCDAGLGDGGGKVASNWVAHRNLHHAAMTTAGWI